MANKKIMDWRLLLMINVNNTYANMLQDILDLGDTIVGRNSEVKRLTNLVVTFSSTPLLTTRKTAWLTALREMEWFLSGPDSVQDLHPSVHSWWRPWAGRDGAIHGTYGKQLRAWGGSYRPIDQVAYLIEGLNNHPTSRRLCATTWNPVDVPSMPITNCHGSWIQVNTGSRGEVNLTMVQRSADMVVGVAHNWIQYWAFLLWLCHVTARPPGKLFWHGVDCHIYKDHYDLAKEIVRATDKAPSPPKMLYVIDLNKPLESEFRAQDFKLDSEYKPVLTKRARMVV